MHLPASFQTHQQRQSQAYCNAVTMTAENVSEDEKQNTFMIEELYCSTDITAAIRGQLPVKGTHRVLGVHYLQKVAKLIET